MAEFRENKRPWLTDILLGGKLRSQIEGFTSTAEAGAKASAATVMAATSKGGGGRPVSAPVGSTDGPKRSLVDSVYGKVAIGVGYGYGPESLTDRWIGLVGSNSAAAGPYEFGREKVTVKNSRGGFTTMPAIPAQYWLSRGTGVKG